MKSYEAFNHSGLSKFLNSKAGRIFRIVMGIIFIAVGYMYRNHVLGVLSIVWGLFPLSAGVFDICYVSAVLGGPFSGTKIRDSN